MFFYLVNEQPASSGSETATFPLKWTGSQLGSRTPSNRTPIPYSYSTSGSVHVPSAPIYSFSTRSAPKTIYRTYNNSSARMRPHETLSKIDVDRNSQRPDSVGIQGITLRGSDLVQGNQRPASIALERTQIDLFQREIFDPQTLLSSNASNSKMTPPSTQTVQSVQSSPANARCTPPTYSVCALRTAPSLSRGRSARTPLPIPVVSSERRSPSVKSFH